MNSEKIDLWVDRKSSQVSMENSQLVWRINKKKQDQIPLNLLNSVTFWGNTIIESRLLCALSKQGISVAFMTSSRQGDGTSLIQTLPSPSHSRLRQYQLQQDKVNQLKIAQNIVLGKLRNYDKSANGINTINPDLICFQKRFETKIKSTITLAQLMGIEGSASRIWFQELARIIPEKWEFSGRHYYPATDPINALLSLSYTLASQPLRQALMAQGLDLSLGCLHQTYSGRESLVCDAIEWMRSSVDCFIVDLLQHLDTENFTIIKNENCILNKNGRKYFYEFWWERYDSWKTFLPDNQDTDTKPLPKQCWALARYFKNSFFDKQNDPF